MLFQSTNGYELGQDKKCEPIHTRILAAIQRNDLSFIKENAPPTLPEMEQIILASLYNRSSEITNFLIDKYHSYMDMNEVFDYIISHGKLDIAQKMYQNNTGTWSFEAVRLAALAGYKNTVDWCTSIKKLNVLEEMALHNAQFKYKYRYVQ